MNATRRARAFRIDPLQSLDDRITPSGGMVTPSVVPAYQPTGTTMDKMGQTLNVIYQEYQAYEAAGAKGAFVPNESSSVFIGGPNNTSVGVDIKVGANFNLVVSELQGIGMQVNATSPANGIVEGYLPDSKLPLVASDGNVVGISPVLKPSLNGVTVVPVPPAYHLTGTPLDKMGQTLNIIEQEYQNYQAAGGKGTFTPQESSQIFFGGPNNTSVGVDIQIGANDGLVVSELEGIGFQMVASNSTGLVEGYLPVSKLDLVAYDGNITSISPVFKPSLN